MLTQQDLEALGISDLSPLKIGDRVKKVTGDYRITGEVRSVFTMANGAIRIVVEHTADEGGSFLHIYSPANVVLLPPKAPAEHD